ncbi:hypothetical protein BJ165DRAFT_1613970 [Panaeolus papilionaceus]|nr:hypothetical protein BJ165DRAFT_1613970 [Panaeolus papilionaceus]
MSVAPVELDPSFYTWLLDLLSSTGSTDAPPESATILRTTPSTPDFTDWLHISPAGNFHTDLENFSTGPLHDISLGQRVNGSPSLELGLHYDYDDRPEEQIPGGHLHSSQSGPPQSSFNTHNRMLSLDSSTTLVNSPSSSRSFSNLSPGHSSKNFYTSPHSLSVPSSSSWLSPMTLDYLQELRRSPYANYGFDHSGFPVSTQVLPPFDVSPVIRADELPLDVAQPASQPPSKAKKKRQKRRLAPTATFADKLLALPSSTDHPEIYVIPPLETVCNHSQASAEDGPCSLNVASYSTDIPALLSPCKLSSRVGEESDQNAVPESVSSSSQEKRRPTIVIPPLRLLPAVDRGPATPSPATPNADILSPLTPLTPLSSSPSPPPPSLTIKLKIPPKRQRTESPGPVRRSKRSRPVATIETSSPAMSEFEPNPTPSPQKHPQIVTSNAPSFTNRTLPENIEISSNYTLFYRRFPASSFYQTEDTISPCILFDMSHPGGVYNPPRSPLDLYTPRFVKGKGAEKVGLCPICVEAPERGGENKKMWLAMKFSAFKYYHMQYAHGISASTGLPFSPPVAFRIIPRPNAARTEKTQIQQGKCHKCDKWICVEGIKDMECKVPELYWWKHAASCHHDSRIPGEGDFYEDDYVLKKLMALRTPS